MKKLAVVLSLVVAAALTVSMVGAQEGDSGRPFRNRPRLTLHTLRDMTRLIADETGLTPRQVLAQVRDGKTLGEVVTENGGDVQTVIDAALATASERLTEAVANGRIRQNRADEMLARLQTLYSEMMNRRFRLRVGAFV